MKLDDTMKTHDIENQKRNSRILTSGGILLVGFARSFRSAYGQGIEFIIMITGAMLLCWGELILWGVVKSLEKQGTAKGDIVLYGCARLQ